MTRVCAHAANGLTRHGAQSTASLVVRITPAGPTCWATGTSAPCTSVFKPLWLDGDVLPDIGPPPAERFDDGSLWWRHERLHRRMLRDLPAALARLDSPRADLEAELLRRAADAPVDGASAEHRFSITRDAFDRARALEDEVLADPAIRNLPRRTSLRYRLYWARQNRRAGVPA
jgi:dipeptidase